MTSYVALIVYALGKGDGAGVFYREDFVLVRAADREEAVRRAREHIDRETYEPADGRYVRLHALVDVNEATEEIADAPTTDLYSRHFADLESYRSFEMFLGGKDPLA
ncbi:DUF4288 domain-containing protein [Nocardia puris]|uniref:DUF4288 domain-containing protein n=1 Tax=Nocardia puris TaxID=208602 RepID=UPI001894DBD2|nr:DUF4288 domain-containing protein [Nocardia puris]MBF6211323.1 DUF4288 domain-containing protein [Nocardia puris]